MRVAMLGSGNVATHLSKALIKAGHPVAQVWSRNNEHAINLALHIGANSISNLSEIDESINLIILAVADDAIESIAAEITPSQSKILVHTSGSINMDVLNSHPKAGVFYPLQTFSKHTDVDFSQIPICIEAADKITSEELRMVAKSLSENVHIVNSYNRMLLHISAVFACNFTNYFYQIAENLLKESDLNFDLIRPLIQETSAKVLLNKPSEVQTGPAKRNDQITLNKHLELLNSKPELKEMYALISQNIVKMYQVSGATAK